MKGVGKGRGGGIAYVLFYFREATDASHKLILYCNVFFRSRPIGSDIEAGELVLSPGTLLGAAEVGVLAAVGATVVTVSSLPRIAVLSTGRRGGGGVLAAVGATVVTVSSLPRVAVLSTGRRGGRRPGGRWRHCRHSLLPSPRRRPINR